MAYYAAKAWDLIENEGLARGKKSTKTQKKLNAQKRKEYSRSKKERKIDLQWGVSV